MMYGLLGRTLGHSFSPPIHKQLADYDYRLFEMEEDQLAAFIRRPDIGGLNVTIPYKKTVIPLCDALSPTAERIGSVNTLVYDADRRIIGHNTDYAGLCWLLRYAGIDPRGKKAALLGNGGVCQTVKAVLRDLGVRDIVVVHLTAANGAVSYDDVHTYQDAELVFNTTPVGMYPHCPAAVIPLSRFPQCEGFVDMIYNPLRTSLLLEAEQRGIPCCNGLPMLVAQAKAAAELFTGAPIPDEKTEEVLRSLAAQQSNVILVGMPGSGKSTVGRRLASALGLTFKDLDEEIVRAAGCSIPDLFAQGGEPLFRDWERRIVQEHGKHGGVVLATGGGVVLDERNWAPLAQNGTILWLQRELDSLATEGRPLSKDRATLASMYATRAPLYERFSNAAITNNGSLEDTVTACMQILQSRTLIGAPKGAHTL